MVAGHDAMQLDQPPEKVGIGHLPERIFSASEQLTQERCNGVGEGIGIEPVRGQGIPLPGSIEAQLDVIVFPAGVGQDRADLVAEVPLHFEHQGCGPFLGIRRLPGEQLAGKGRHAGGCFPRAHGPEDCDAGVEAPLWNHEPIRIGDRPDLDPMVGLANDDGGCFVVGRNRPLGQRAPPRPPAAARFDPDPPAAEQQHPPEQDKCARSDEIPRFDGPGRRRGDAADQHQRGDGAGVGKRMGAGPADNGNESGNDENDVGPPHQKILQAANRARPVSMNRFNDRWAGFRSGRLCRFRFILSPVFVRVRAFPQGKITRERPPVCDTNGAVQE